MKSEAKCNYRHRNNGTDRRIEGSWTRIENDCEAGNGVKSED